MKAIRITMFSAMALLIGGGTYALASYQETGHIEAASVDQPTAYIEATNMNLSFKIGGRINQIYVKEGDHVKKGQLLARIDSKELQDKAAQAQAALQAADAGVGQAQAAVSAAEAKKLQGSNSVTVTAETAERQVSQAQAAVKAAQAHLEALKNGARPEEKQQAQIKMNAAKEANRIAEDNLKRTQALFQAGAVPQAKVDEAELNYQKAKAEYDASVKQYELVKQGPRAEEIKAAQAQVEQAQAAVALAEANRGQVTLRQDDVRAAEAGVSQAQAAVSSASASVSKAQAALNEANTYISYTELRAPSDGIITVQSAQNGELVGAGFPVLTLESNQDRWAKFYFPENRMAGMKTGDEVGLKVISTGKIVKGRVTVIQPAADFAIQKPSQSTGDTDVRSFGVKVTLLDLPDTIATGMTLQWQGKGAK